MSNFGDLSIFNGSSITGNGSSKDQDDQSFEKWMQQARNNQNKQRTQVNGNTAANQDPSTLQQNIIEAERFSRESTKNNTSYIFYKRVVSTSKPESEFFGAEGYDKKFTAPKSQVKFSGSQKSEIVLGSFIGAIEEESEHENEQTKEEGESESEGSGLPNTRDSLKRVSRDNQQPENENENEPAQEETHSDSEEQALPSPNDTLILPLKRKKERDSDTQDERGNDSDDSNSNNQQGESSSFQKTNNILLPIHIKKESDQQGSYGTQQEAIAGSLGIDPKNLIGLAAELLLDQGPFGRMTRAIAGFCINDAIHFNGVWETYIAIDQKILAETTLFLRLTSFELVLRFKTTDAHSSKLIRKNEKKLEASISLVMDSKGYARVLQIFIED